MGPEGSEAELPPEKLWAVWAVGTFQCCLGTPIRRVWEGHPLASRHHCRVVRPPPGQRPNLFPSLSAALFLLWPGLPLQSLMCNHRRSITRGAGMFPGGNPQILSTE